jgi:hypothetical protein
LFSADISDPDARSAVFKKLSISDKKIGVRLKDPPLKPRLLLSGIFPQENGERAW